MVSDPRLNVQMFKPNTLTSYKGHIRTLHAYAFINAV
jgi:hypothetical protein